MILTKVNLAEWKQELECECKRRMPIEWHGLSGSLYDEQWLSDYIGEDTADVVDDEISILCSM